MTWVPCIQRVNVDTPRTELVFHKIIIEPQLWHQNVWELVTAESPGIELNTKCTSLHLILIVFNYSSFSLGVECSGTLILEAEQYQVTPTHWKDDTVYSFKIYWTITTSNLDFLGTTAILSVFGSLQTVIVDPVVLSNVKINWIFRAHVSPMCK